MAGSEEEKAGEAGPAEAGPAEPATASPVAEEPADIDAVPAEDEVADDGFMSEGDAKLAEANARYLRLAADFDNYRKRSVRETTDAVAGAEKALVKEFLPVLDNLERALVAAAEAKVDDGTPHAAAVDAVAKGVELTMRQLKSSLSKQGVERILSVGKKFNPHMHEALLQEERDDVEVETVTEELEAGYALRGSVIRPARVKVAKPAAKA